MIGTPEPRRAPGETWMVAGASLFLLGLLAILTAIVPFVLGHGSLPPALLLATALAPVGVLVGLVGPASARRAARTNPTVAAAGRGASRVSLTSGTPTVPPVAPAPDQVVLPEPSPVTPA